MTRRIVAFVAGLCLWLACAWPAAAATMADAAGAPPATPAPERSYLSVALNGVETDEVVEVQRRDGRLLISRDVLARLGLILPGDAPPLIAVDQLRDVRTTFREETQTLDIEAPARALRRAGPSFDDDAPPPALDPAAWGGALNYAGSAVAGWRGQASLSGYGEARVFGPRGELSSSFAGRTSGFGPGLQRLDTTLVLPDYARARTLAVGDFITSGLAWTRPVRAAGVSYSRDFSLRPDLVTQPTAVASGGAAAPSVVNLFLDGVRQASMETPTGPFSLRAPPVLDGQGRVSVVVTDVLGRQSQQSFDFYSSSSLLRPGLATFSLESGVMRRDYAGPDDRYRDAFAAASLRRGLTPGLTLEGHAEAASGLANFGAGAVGKVREAVLVSGAVAVSESSRGAGAQVYLAAQRVTGRYRLFLSVQQSLGDYEDLATRSGDPRIIQLAQANVSRSFGGWGTFNLGYSRLHTRGARTAAATIGWSRPLALGATLFVNAYAVTEGQRDHSVMVGVTLPLGGRAAGSVAASRSSDGVVVSGSAASNPAAEGGWGWSLAGQSGASTDTVVEADARHLGPGGEQAVGVAWNSGRAWARAYAGGGLVWLAGDRPRLASQNVQSFALVDAGAPGVSVLVNNREAGRSGRDGRVLVSGLPGYLPSTLALDPLSAPMDMDLGPPERRVIPARGVGLRVDMRVRRPTAVYARMVLPDGHTPPVGSAVVVEGREVGVVGYDGVVYLSGLTGRQSVQVSGDWGACQATLLHVSDTGSGRPMQLGTVACRPGVGLQVASRGAPP